MRRSPAWFIGLLLVYAWLGHRYAPVWQSDLTLWSYARAHAPRKARPSVNYVKALYGAGREREAQTVIGTPSWGR